MHCLLSPDEEKGKIEVTERRAGDPTSSAGPPWQVIDQVWVSYAENFSDVALRWLLLQTMATSVMRRHLLTLLGVKPGWRTLDVGTGFGPIPMELAASVPVEAYGVDVDAAVLEAANEIRVRVEERSGFQPTSRVQFAEGDAYDLAHEERSLDLVTSRFVFQHLREPVTAVSEMARVVKPGGLVCVIDVDDGLAVTYPEPSESYQLLANAVSRMQGTQGGGRDVARRIPALLDQGGFDVRTVLALPSAEYRASRPGDLDRLLLVQRFEAARDALIEQGHLAVDEFDRALAQVSAEVRAPECSVVTHLAVIGERR